MSPEARAADHVYRLLKADILRGRYAPTTTLNVHTIAIEIGTSISPVRDSMERLVGERLLAVRQRGGFHMPDVTLESARGLYEWHSFLIIGALSRRRPIGKVTEVRNQLDRVDPEDREALTSATSELFYRIGEAAGNTEHLLAIRAAGERLQIMRLCEQRFKDPKGELRRIVDLAIAGSIMDLRNSISVYHRRRLRNLPYLVHTLNEQIDQHK